MSIKFDEVNRVFNLSTPNTTYLCGILRERFLLHIYYGKKVKTDVNISDLVEIQSKGFSVTDEKVDSILISKDTMQLEYSASGTTDLRICPFCARYNDGSVATDFKFFDYKITTGKPKLEGLPCCYVENESEADTLEIFLIDEVKHLKVVLSYTVYNDRDIITRSVKVFNESKENVELLKVMSLNLDMFDQDYDFVSLKGSWLRERYIQKTPVIMGNISIGSRRGASSHMHNPFFALSRKNANEDLGDVYGFGFVYSGNFVAGVEANSWGTTRAYMGINDCNFKWILKPNESFQAPEVVMTYSDCGFNKMSQNFHDLVRERICRGKFKKTQRPVLINNWEATYFDFNEEKIINIAKCAKDLGVELMVLDDGWFGKRNNDKTSLGDWYPNKDKLPNGINGLAEKIKKLGLEFGLWFEPEMVSPDSDLYRSHPDWILHIEGRTPTLGRYQYVLDLSRKDVCNYIIQFMTESLSSSPISYVKWDMNRYMSEVGSSKLPPENQQEVAHRYMLGLYYILETLTARFPDVLFEGCSGGGGRFDLGMLYYYPQFWTSDNSDAVERMYIQYGTSMIYPSSVMSAHVSAIPNHQVNRVTPIETRGNIAMIGRFGYELDINKLSDEEKEIIKKQINTYKKWGEVIHNADMYRLMSPFDTNNFAMEFLSKDKKYIVVVFGSILGIPQAKNERLYFRGLDMDSKYKNIESGIVYGGDVLSNIGFTMKNKGDFTSEMLIFERQ